MKDLAFLIHGQTFFKSMAPLIYFSNKAGIRPHVIVSLQRPGKPHDNVKLDTLKKLFENVIDGKCYLIDRPECISEVLDQIKVKSFVCQDAQHHARDLCTKYKAYSIGVFFDTVHYGVRYNKKTAVKPHRTYFSDQYFKKEFENHIGDSWPTGVFGAPHLDHSLFIEQKPRDHKSVLFLTPLQGTIESNTQDDLEEFIEYCGDNNIQFIMKDRPKSKWVFKNSSLLEKIAEVNNENGFPYTSLSLILNTDIHVTSYGTSSFEAQFFGKPVMNMDVLYRDKHPLEIRCLKKHYDVDSIFNNQKLCQTAMGGFIDLYESLKDRRDTPQRALTMDDNFSLDILKDILFDL